MSTLRVLQNGDRVLVLVNGGLVADIPWQKGDEVARAITTATRKAEEWAKAEAIASDQAILLRAGVPLGLSNHPAIRAEALKLALNDRALRRYMPGGVKARAEFGAPVIRQGGTR